MQHPIWIALALAFVGTILLTVFGLFWPRAESALHEWGYRIGVLLLLAGFAVATVSI